MLLCAQKSTKIDLLLHREVGAAPVDLGKVENRSFLSEYRLLASVKCLGKRPKLRNFQGVFNDAGDVIADAFNGILLRPSRGLVGIAHFVVERDSLGQVARLLVCKAAQEGGENRVRAQGCPRGR